MMKQRKRSLSLLLFLLVCLFLICFPAMMRGGGGLRFVRQAAQEDSLRRMEAAGYIADAELPPLLPIEIDSLLSGVVVPFVDSLCRISDPEQSLERFFAELNALRQNKDTVINVVHLGDSHIQAGYYTGRMMRLMQEQFGNAGRGFIAPLKLSKVNEPDDYFINSVIREWVTGRCIQRTQKTTIGPGGIGIQSESPAINLDVIIAPKNGYGYAFNQAIFYRYEKAMPMLPAGNLKDSIQTALAVQTAVPGILADTFRLSCLTDTLLLHSTRRLQGTDSLLPPSHFDNTYYGLNLTNGKSGLLYHALGVNGSMFVNFTDPDYIRQLALLKPSLLIISLGTNETFGKRFRKEEFAGQVRSFLALVRKYLPETTLLLTTPPECYTRVWVNKKRTFTRNNNTEPAARALVEVAREQGIACWDLFTATGGKNSHKKWFEKKLMGRDRIHFNKEGYRDQGTLLFSALMRNYNETIKENAINEDCLPTEEMKIPLENSSEELQEEEANRSVIPQ